MIWVMMPYAPREHDKDLTWCYNVYLSLVPDGDWVCFIDHDAMFTTYSWFPQLEDIIETHSEYILFTAKTNRVHNDQQQVKGISDTHDIRYHRALGKLLQDKYYLNVEDMTDRPTLSGVIMLLKKGVIDFSWKGIRGNDTRLHTQIRERKLGKVGLMCGVYVYHWYRYDKMRCGRKWLQENPINLQFIPLLQPAMIL